MMTDRMKIHVINNPKTKAMLSDGKDMTTEKYRQIFLDTGISHNKHSSVLGCQNEIYVVEGHESQDELYELLKRENLPLDLRHTLTVSETTKGFRETYEWGEKNTE